MPTPCAACCRTWPRWRLSLATDATGLAVFADEAGTGHTRVVRAFCPADAPAVPEDP